MSNGDQTFLLEYIIEILKTTSKEHPIQKQRIIQILNNKYDVYPSRGTINAKFDILVKNGYQIEKIPRKGFYLENQESDFTDGELRMLIDSVLYSGILTEKYSADIIEKLAKLGSQSFCKSMEKLAIKAKNIDKSANNKILSSILINVEDIQQAISENRQISCNCVTYNQFFEPENIYDEDIVVNPYELAFSDGKYYLVCAIEKSEEISVLRLDRLTDIGLLDSRCVEIELLKKIRNDKGLQNYIYSQPQLKGGRHERFTLICYRGALDEVYDAFGNNLRIRTDKIENYDDPDTAIVTVETTHEAMKSWAVMHSENVVVIKPQEVRDEIVDALKSAEYTYFKSGKPAWIRSWTARSLDEAIREMRISGRRSLHYTGRGKKDDLEKIDIGSIDLSDITSLSLWGCDISESSMTGVFSELKTLNLIGSKFDTEIFEHFPSLSSISVARSDIDNIDFVKHYKNLRRLCISECADISDFSALYALDKLKKFETDNINFTEIEAENLQTKFPECQIKILKSHRADHKK